MKHYEKFCQSQLASQSKNDDYIQNTLANSKKRTHTRDLFISNEKETLLTDESEKFSISKEKF